MNELKKPFLTIDQQIEMLEKRGLVIKNKSFAKKQLLQTTYYDLVNGYKDMFLMKIGDSDDEKFLQDTTLDDILELYELDRQLRYMVLELLLDIECRFYSSISYAVSYFYGEESDFYLHKKNYRIGAKQRVNERYERDNLLFRLNKKINYPEVQPLIYYKCTYNNIPPWILVKDMTFGELKVFYKLSQQNVKSLVINNILYKEEIDGKIKEFFMKSINLFNNFRNWCAHGGRIYNFKSKACLPYYEEFHKKLNITHEDYQKGKSKNDFSALIIAALFFFQSDYKGFIEFRVKLNGYLDDFRKTNYMQYQTLLDELGIPDNYSDLIDIAIGIGSVEIPQN